MYVYSPRFYNMLNESIRAYRSVYLEKGYQAPIADTPRRSALIEETIINRVNAETALDSE